MANSLDDFVPYVSSKVPSCGNEEMIRREVRNAVIDFAQGSRFHRHQIDAMNVLDGIDEYDVDVPRYNMLVQVEQVDFDGKPLDPTEKTELSALYANWTTLTGKPDRYMMTDLNLIRLFRTPIADLTQGLVIEVSLKPARASTVVDARFYEEYAEAIACGAARRILMTTEYRDQAVASTLNSYLGEFNAAKDEALRRGNAYYATKRPRRAKKSLF